MIAFRMQVAELLWAKGVHYDRCSETPFRMPGADTIIRCLGMRLCAAICLCFAGCGSSALRSRMAGLDSAPVADREVDLTDIFEQAGAVGTFVLLDDRTAAFTRHNPARASQRFVPASTFKIANSLIALETGVANGPDFTLRYDPAVNPPRASWPLEWAHDQTMRTAIRHSVVWFYQELARRIGPQRMKSFIDRFTYGNRDISGPVDRFWLQGPLRISPDEQAVFLRRLYHGRLGVSEQTSRIVKEILVLAETPEYRLSGKSGTLSLTPTRQLAWHVGYIEQSGDASFYALNMEGEHLLARWPPDRRVDLVREICSRLGVLR